MLAQGNTDNSILDELHKLDQRELTFGEKLVGITFNPSNDGDVAEIKTKVAELANLLYERNSQNESSLLSKAIYDAAIVSLLEAQMMAVKYVTLKY